MQDFLYTGLDFIPQYIRGKNNPENITYDCPQLEPILKATYGCIVYQEQVMQIVRSLGGYTLGRSDLVRRAMSKKKASVMEKERRNFVYGNEEEGVPGCVNRGIREKTANKIYDDMIDFAKYAFNKSHAAAYAVVSYQTAFLKCYYPVEFMAALMTSVIENPSKVSEYILSSRRMGISILPPDVNQGESSFSVDGGAIRYGLSAIKSIGKPVIESLVEERTQGIPLEQWSNDMFDPVIQEVDTLFDYPVGQIHKAAEKLLRNGNPIPMEWVTASEDGVTHDKAEEKLFKLYDWDKHFIGLYMYRDEIKDYKPRKLFYDFS